MKWQEKTFKQLGYISRGRSRHRPRNEESLYGGKYPFVQTGDIKAANFYISEYTQTYNEKGLAQSKLWSKDTLCITIAANIAETALLNFDACFPDSVIGFVADKEVCNVQFIKYYFDIFKEKMKSIAVGAAQDNLSMEKLDTFKVLTPPLTVQNRIASILSAYDVLIENNLQRIKLLEQATKLEYKLLMKRVDNFERVPIKDVLEHFIGGGWGNDEQNAEYSTPAYVIRGTDIPELKLGNTSRVPFRFHTESNLKSRLLQANDIIFEVSGGSKTSPVGRSLFVSQEAIEQFNGSAMCASFCKLMRANDKITPELLYLFLHESFTDGSLKPYEKPSASNIINFAFEKYIDECTIPIPSYQILQEWTGKVSKHLKLSSILASQNTQLRQARDILMPKLMSGQIDVSKMQPVSKLIPLQAPVVSMVAEDEPVYQTKKPKGGAKYYFRTLLAAYIVNNLWQEKTFGHVKLMKLMYLSEHVAHIETVSNYHRDAAGPYDNQMMRSIDKQLKDKKWFEMYKKDGKYPKYKPMEKAADFIPEFAKYHSDKQTGIDNLIQQFGKASTEQVEMVATTYEAWRHLSTNNHTLSIDAILNEILNLWHESKARISRDRWVKCYEWLLSKGWITM